MTNFMKTLIMLMTMMLISLQITSCTANKSQYSPVRKTALPAYESDRPYYDFIMSQLQLKTRDLDNALMSLKKAVEKDPESVVLKRELALVYIEQKDSANAMKMIDQILSRHPEDIDTLILSGNLRQSLGDVETAEKNYEKILSLDPKQNDIYLLLGDIYLESDRPDQAFTLYSQLIGQFPQSYVGHYYLGRIYAEKGQIEKAEQEYKKTLQLAPDLQEPHFDLIRLYEKIGKEDSVIRQYQELLIKDPENIQALMALGYIYFKDGRLQDSDKYLLQLGQKSLTDKVVIQTVIQNYLDQNKNSEAVIILEGMLKGAPNSSEIHYLKGIAHERLKDFDRAVDHLTKVSPDSMFYTNAVIQTAFLYQDQGQLTEAIAFLKGVIEQHPEMPEVGIYLGSLYEEAGAFSEAREVYQQALVLTPDNAELHFRSGVVYDRLGDKESSIREMRRVIQLDPEHPNALNYLGYTFAEMGTNLDEAERLIREALKYKPDDGYILDSLGWVYFKKGLFKEALQHLEKAVSLVPEDPTILEHLGDVYREFGNKKKALDFYRRSMEKAKTDASGINSKIRSLTGEDL
ncbi:MAG: tetratricopeptide repeat protein [Desulfobacterales bacterium]|nr:tetratricopeptide repeat protein [Desulfobacterales bacterium]MDD4393366.1 tetratricopeptide repeat protein [Desulfobacterales bacterium]